MSRETVVIATRGSALALAQSNMVAGQLRAHFPGTNFELRVIKTTGDKLQRENPPDPGQTLPKGLFTKELELALLDGEADLAVHSLKDLPTELPNGLSLTGVSPREDVRDVLIYLDAAQHPGRGLPAGAGIHDLPLEAVIATSSTRRQAQVQSIRADIKTVAIRGNVGTRLRKLAENREYNAIILALAGLKRLGFEISSSGVLTGPDVPPGLLACALSTDIMLPCVGQAALGFESRAEDLETTRFIEKLNDPITYACVTAERAFLAGMGGGCLSPVGALAEAQGEKLLLRAISFRGNCCDRTTADGPIAEPAALGARVARQLLGKSLAP